MKSLFDKITKDYVGIFYKFVDADFNCFVYTGANGAGDKSKMVGRMVQVRTKAGIAGTDKALLRHLDGSLTVHENQCFIKVTNKKDIKILEEAFKDVCSDANDEEYKCDKGVPATGFIVAGLPESEEILSFTITTMKNEVSK